MWRWNPKRQQQRTEWKLFQFEWLLTVIYQQNDKIRKTLGSAWNISWRNQHERSRLKWHKRRVPNSRSLPTGRSKNNPVSNRVKRGHKPNRLKRVFSSLLRNCSEELQCDWHADWTRGKTYYQRSFVDGQIVVQYRTFWRYWNSQTFV